jgi:hypothetical protein
MLLLASMVQAGDSLMALWRRRCIGLISDALLLAPFALVWQGRGETIIIGSLPRVLRMLWPPRRRRLLPTAILIAADMGHCVC